MACLIFLLAVMMVWLKFMVLTRWMSQSTDSKRLPGFENLFSGLHTPSCLSHGIKWLLMSVIDYHSRQPHDTFSLIQSIWINTRDKDNNFSWKYNVMLCHTCSSIQFSVLYLCWEEKFSKCQNMYHCVEFRFHLALILISAYFLKLRKASPLLISIPIPISTSHTCNESIYYLILPQWLRSRSTLRSLWSEALVLLTSWSWGNCSWHVKGILSMCTSHQFLFLGHEWEHHLCLWWLCGFIWVWWDSCSHVCWVGGGSYYRTSAEGGGTHDEITRTNQRWGASKDWQPQVRGNLYSNQLPCVCIT